MVRFRLYANKDEETAYLNEMAARGYAMTGFFAGFYSFEKCRPGEFIYQVDITEGWFRVSSDYREFMQEMGVEIICPWGMWVILRKKVAEGPFVLYTDVESGIEHYTKIKKMFKTATMLELICLIMEIALAGSTTDKATIAMALAFISLVGAIVIVFLREIARVNGILAQLRERAGQESPGNRCGKSNVSLLLSLGLTLNGIGYLIPTRSTLYAAVRGILHGLAIVFMGLGIISTLWKRED